jgi:ArsR family transcriptional regulator
MKLLEKDEDINKATKALKAMAHPLRLKILCVLKSDELPVLEIVEQVGSSQSNISQHIVHKIVKLVKNGILMIIHIYAKVSVYKSV